MQFVCGVQALFISEKIYVRKNMNRKLPGKGVGINEIIFLL